MKMKLSLNIKIWLFLTAITTLLFVIYSVLFPMLVRETLREPVPKTRDALSSPNHFRKILLLDDGTVLSNDEKNSIPSIVIEQSKNKAFEQRSASQIYLYDDGEQQYRYEIQKFEIEERVYYMINFFDRKIEDRFVDFLFQRIIQFAGIALILCWFLALFVSKYLTRPLIKMEQHVRRLADKDRNEPLMIMNNDEFGQLAQSIETMRLQLIQQDQTQQMLLQNISHELKTPVMVIQGYVQGLQDGLVPCDEQSRVLGIIEKECGKLESLIKQLLYLTMLDYISSQSDEDRLRILSFAPIELDLLVEDTLMRFDQTKPEIQRVLDLKPVRLCGNEDQWRVIIENLIDNHLRYAAKSLTVTLDRQEESVTFKVHNDGSSIDPLIQEQLFQPFRKEKEGKYGLGLTIVRRLVDMYHGHLQILNEKGGVSTIVTLKDN